jgi:hypothetical protein
MDELMDDLSYEELPGGRALLKEHAARQLERQKEQATKRKADAERNRRAAIAYRRWDEVSPWDLDEFEFLGDLPGCMSPVCVTEDETKHRKRFPDGCDIKVCRFCYPDAHRRHFAEGCGRPNCTACAGNHITSK